tara:strand:+ start:311 stop:583 length:273 start_codon:yes stop_codon:yes gene_type:complete
MKKLILSLTIITSMSLLISSCGEEENTTQPDPAEHGKYHHNGDKEHEHHGKHAAEGEVNYQCPMECEGDKVYDSPGHCPVCEMDLEEKEK